MATLQTDYMGIPLTSPIVVAASTLSNMIDRIQRAEEAGVGALVIRSLFEEQIRAEQDAHDSGKHPIKGDHIADARVYFPNLDSDAARSHLYWVKKSREAVKMPLIASLNAITPGGWTQFAKELENTGVDGLELNIYSVAADPTKTGQQLEDELFEIVQSVIDVVDIPVSVKLSPFYTSIANVCHRLSDIGAKGIVLFNRFLQPEIRVATMSLHLEQQLSTSKELTLPLRWTAILHGRMTADLSLSTGVHSGDDVIKALLAGAQTVQIAAAFYQHGLDYTEKLHDDLSRWMSHNNFESLADFRGTLSQKNVDNPAAFERAQYIRMLMREG